MREGSIMVGLVDIARITISPGGPGRLPSSNKASRWSPSFHFSRARANSWKRRLRVRQSLRFRSKRSSFESVSRRSFPTKGTPFPELLDDATRLVAEGLRAEFAKVLKYLPEDNRF